MNLIILTFNIKRWNQCTLIHRLTYSKRNKKIKFTIFFTISSYINLKYFFKNIYMTELTMCNLILVYKNNIILIICSLRSNLSN